MLMFEPSSGTVPAQGQLALAVTFAPTSATPTNFNVMCTIKKKPTQLSLNVKGEGYAVHDSLQIQGADGRLVDLSSDSPNHLDFGQVCFCTQNTNQHSTYTYQSPADRRVTSRIAHSVFVILKSV